MRLTAGSAADGGITEPQGDWRRRVQPLHFARERASDPVADLVANQFPSVQSFLAIPDAPVITWGHKVYNTQCIPGSSHELYKKPGALRNRSMVVVELEPLGLPAISWELPALEMASRHQIQVLRVVRRPNISVVAALTPQNISKPSK